MKLLRQIHILKDHFYSHIPLTAKLDRIDAKLRLLLDNSIPIDKVKIATGTDRIRQEIGMQILRIVARIAEKSDIPFWLDYGSLLGAVRHGGFVPWDDDIDMSILHRDYQTMFSALKEYLPKDLCVSYWQDNSISTDEPHDGNIHVIEPESGCHMDIFSFIEVPGALNSNGHPTEWENEYLAKYEEFSRECTAEGYRRALEMRIHGWWTTNGKGDGDMSGIAPSMVFLLSPKIYRRVYPTSWIFPLQKTVFEGCEFPAPGSPDSLLSMVYDDYKRFPSDAGLGIHGHKHQFPANPIQLRHVLDKLTTIASQMK